MKKKQIPDKSIIASKYYEIKETRIKNGIVYLKIAEFVNKNSINYVFKWIIFSTAHNSSDELK